MRFRSCFTSAFNMALFMLAAVAAQGQGVPQTREQGEPQVRGRGVPRLLRFEDALRDGRGAPRSSPVAVTFAVYASREAGAPLWQETQNVVLDEQGRYRVLLGAASREGLPADLFDTEEPRWLGVRVYVPGDTDASAEPPRVLLVSVPYAMRAEDSAFLGGRPATDYVLREQLVGWSGALPRSIGANPQSTSGGGSQFLVNATSSGVGFIPKVTAIAGADVTYGDSLLTDDGNTVAIGTPSSSARFEINLNTATGQIAQNNDVTLSNAAAVGGIATAMRLRLFDASTAAVDSKQALRVVYRRQSTANGAVNNFDSGVSIATFFDADGPYTYRTFNIEGPRVAAGKTLQRLFGVYIEAPFNLGGTVSNTYALVTEPGSGNVGIGTTMPSEALDVSGVVRATGGVRFGDGSLQTTAATGGGGSVTNVTTGLGLTGGPITSTGTVAIDPAVVPQLGATNTFTANQTINGNLTLTGSTATVTGLVGIFDGSGGGVVGRDTTSAGGVGVHGIADGANGAGVLGRGTATAGASNVGVRGVSAGSNGAGVLAEATNTAGGAGIRAVANSITGTAGRFDNNQAGNLIEGRFFDILFGSYQQRFRVDSNGFVHGNSFRDLQTGKNVGLATNCTTGQIMKYDGTNWACAADGGGTGGGSGDVTDVLATFGGGLTVVNSGGPQPSLGLITTCATNQILKWTGFSWACANDANTNLAGATIVRTNTFLGTSAGNAALTGNLNTAYGDSAMTAITSGSENTAFGAQVMGSITAESRNTAIGRWAMLAATGSDNTVVGNSAFSNSAGSKNTALGLGALANSPFVNGTIAIGFGACTGASMNDICIGNGVNDLTFPGGNIRIGNTTTNPHQAAYIAGIFNQTSSSGTTVIINSVGKLGTVLSSARFKEDIVPIRNVSRKLMQLRPVQFHYKPQYDDGSHILQFGLIAEEVDKVFPELVLYGNDGQPDTVRYHFLAPLLLAETQRLQGEVNTLRDALAAQKAQFEAQNARIAEQAAQLAEVKAALAAIQKQQARPLLAAGRHTEQ